MVCMQKRCLILQCTNICKLSHYASQDRWCMSLIMQIFWCGSPLCEDVWWHTTQIDLGLLQRNETVHVLDMENRHRSLYLWTQSRSCLLNYLEENLLRFNPESSEANSMVPLGCFNPATIDAKLATCVFSLFLLAEPKDLFAATPVQSPPFYAIGLSPSSLSSLCSLSLFGWVGDASISLGAEERDWLPTLCQQMQQPLVSLSLSLFVFTTGLGIFSSDQKDFQVLIFRKMERERERKREITLKVTSPASQL